MLMPIFSNLVSAGGGGGTPTLKASAFATDASGSSASLSVPGSPVSGDYLIAVLRCRGDRSFTVPGGWTVHINGDTFYGAGANTNTRVYLLSKPWASESTVDFTQSVSAAYGYALLLGSADVGVLDYTTAEGRSATITKVGDGDLVGLYIDNLTTLYPATATDYVSQGATTFFTSPNYFYVAQAFLRSGVGVGSTTFTHSVTSGSQRGAILFELGS